MATIALLAVVVTSCDKKDVLTFHQKGNEVITLTASSSNITPALADSLNTVVTFSWTDPKYATDSNTYKFILEIDSTGKNFANKTTKQVTGNLGTGFTGRELNNILLKYTGNLSAPSEVDVRVISSYQNNNEKYTSNTIKVKVTPYSDPSKLTTEKTTVTGTAATSSDHSNTFSWTASFPGYSGTISYAVQYDLASNNFASPKEIAGAGGASVYIASLSQGAMNTTALSSGIAVGNPGKRCIPHKSDHFQGCRCLFKCY
ncbi:MAG: SusE domain-containing protein [Bacteroidota bacterium]